VKKIKNRKVCIIHIISHFLIGIRPTLVTSESIAWGTTNQIGPTPPLSWVSISHTNTHTHPVGTLRRSLSTQHTTYASDENPCSQRDSIPRSHQSSGRGPVPYMVRPPWSDPVKVWFYIFSFLESRCMIYIPTHLKLQNQNLHKACCPVCFLQKKQIAQRYAHWEQERG
jgi:hypothetical protein